MACNTTVITFEQFMSEVESQFPCAGETGPFRDFTPEFANSVYDKDRVYYTWQNVEGFGFAAYDTRTPVEGRGEGLVWTVDVGRGMHGFGNTLEEAIADEGNHYDA